MRDARCHSGPGDMVVLHCSLISLLDWDGVELVWTGDSCMHKTVFLTLTSMSYESSRSNCGWNCWGVNKWWGGHIVGLRRAVAKSNYCSSCSCNRCLVTCFAAVQNENTVR